MKYLEQIKSPLWQKKRLLILKRDKFTCQACRDKETELHVHHIKYTGKIWEAPDKDLITYCKNCHYIAELFNKEFQQKIKRVFYFNKLFQSGITLIETETGVFINTNGCTFIDSFLFETGSVKMLSDFVKKSLNNYSKNKEVNYE